MTLNAPSEHQLLVFWVGLFVILVTARLLGALMRRIGQPAVVGELAAGLILGPSVLGELAPGVTNWLFPADDVQSAMLFTVGWLGVLLLLVATGFETDLGLIRRLGRAARTVSTGSLVIPLIAGFGVGWVIPVSFVGGETERFIFAFFIAAALAISSLPVIAKILGEMGFMRRNFGQLTLAAGMANDVVGWVLLGFIAGLAEAGGVEIGKLMFTVVGVSLFFLAAFTIGQRAVDSALRSVRSHGDDPLAGLSVVLITALAFGVITQWLHVEAVLGAFIAGVVIARSRFSDHELIRPVETVTSAFFAPVFFATAGLRVDLGLLADAETLLWAVIVIVAASASKFIGSIIGARVAALSLREGAALGIGLNARGALEIVVATVGLSLDVLNERSYTVIVLMAMVTSMAAPPLLRRVLANWEGSTMERQRLDLERQLASNVIVTDQTVLLPTRGGLSSLLAAQVIDLAWPSDADVTLLIVGDHPDLELEAFRNVLPGRTVRVQQTAETDDLAEAILAEAKLGYGAIVLGADATGHANSLISPLADAVMKESPIPTVIVRRPRGHGRRLPWAFARALVPLSGSRAARGGLEIASYLSSSIGTHIHQLHVSTDPATRIGGLLGDLVPTGAGRQILDDAATVSATAGANHSIVLEHSVSPGAQILASADELAIDLLVMSGTVRNTGDAPFLGQTVQQVLAGCDTTVILAATRERA